MALPSRIAASPISSPLTAAYDAVAPEYDRLVGEDGWMRRLLHERYARLFSAGDRVLDAGCGTGLDTLFLAGRGVEVAAVDLSAAMLATLGSKARAGGLDGSIETRRGDLGDLEGVAREAGWPAASFDGVVSGFAAANSAGLDGFAAGTALLLRAGGRMVLHLLAPAGVWPWLGALARLQMREAAALARRRERAVTIGGHRVHLAVAPAEEMYERHFARDFQLRDRCALGFLWPQRLGRFLPAGLALRLARPEPVLGRRRPFLGWGRFFLLELERR